LKISKNLKLVPSSPLIPKEDPLLHYLQKMGEIIIREELIKGSNIPELRNIIKLIHLSESGIKLYGKSYDELVPLMVEICNAKGFKRISLLFSILEIISSSDEYQLLSTPVANNSINQTDYDRLNKVYEYLINNFQEDIRIEKN
jgi:hypothetical protein